MIPKAAPLGDLSVPQDSFNIHRLYSCECKNAHVQLGAMRIEIETNLCPLFFREFEILNCTSQKSDRRVVLGTEQPCANQNDQVYLNK